MVDKKDMAAFHNISKLRFLMTECNRQYTSGEDVQLL